MSQKQLVQKDIQIQNSLSEVASEFIGLSALSDGLYQKRYGVNSERLAIIDTGAVDNQIAYYDSATGWLKTKALSIQAPLDGTGLVRMVGTGVSYDNNSYYYSGNSNLSTVDWNAKNLTATGGNSTQWNTAYTNTHVAGSDNQSLSTSGSTVSLSGGGSSFSLAGNHGISFANIGGNTIQATLDDLPTGQGIGYYNGGAWGSSIYGTGFLKMSGTTASFDNNSYYYSGNSNLTTVDWTAKNVRVNGSLGIGYTTFSKSIALNGNVSHTIGIESPTTAIDGSSLTINAGSTLAGSTSKIGGNLVLQGGLNTGSGVSGDVQLWTASVIGAISTVSVSNGGSGYSVGNVLNIAGGTGGTVTVTSINPTGGIVIEVVVNNPGTIYTTGVKTTTRVGGGPTSCTINITAVTVTGTSTTSGTLVNRLTAFGSNGFVGINYATNPNLANNYRFGVDGDTDINGLLETNSIKITTGAVDGYFLKSDALGNGSWSPISTSQVYKGTWSPAPNIAPTGTTNGWYYRVIAAGTWNSITFAIGDDIQYNGAWQRIPGQGYTLQLATGNVRGGIMIGTGITMTGDVASVSTAYRSDTWVPSWTDVTSKPTGLSSFTNDVPFIVTETDPVFTAWNKSTGISIVKSQISDFPYIPIEYTDAMADIRVVAGITGKANLSGAAFTGAISGTTATFSGNVTLLNATLSGSDIRLKSNIKAIDLNGVDKVQFKQFTMKSDLLGKTRYGVIAQELELVMPELVYTDDKGIKAVAYIDLLIAKVAQLEERIKQLESWH